MSSEELAYIAGLFDGDGYVGITKHKAQIGKREINPSYKLSISISNANAAILYWLKNIFDGTIETVNEESNNHQKCAAWRMMANKALEFLLLIQPYIRIKREQVDLGIEFQQIRNPHLGRRCLTQEELEHYEWFKKELQRLKKYENDN